MNKESRLMDMLVSYASAHQHPVNIAVHLIGIPTIMLGAFIPMTWLNFDIAGIQINLAQVILLIMFLFYLTLDHLFAVAFLVFAFAVAELAAFLGVLPRTTAMTIAAAAFFGGYAAQFIGHAVEKSMPVLLKHPIQANLAAPFFTIVEVFKLLGLREALFYAVQKRIAELREQQADSG
ncbi:MAG: Mpo1-like protein [Woeseia sp.]